MKRCEVKKGFFVLKECGDVAVSKCSNCKKNICAEHSKNYIKPLTDITTKPAQGENTNQETDTSKVYCLECYAQLNKDNLSKQFQGGYQSSSTTNDLLWYFYMRESFYHQYHYRPFDDYDSKGFNSVSSNTDLDDDTGSSSFYDS